jgi:DNA-binding MarR family transcriptional regulator
MTTALRWIEYLVAQKLIVRESHPTDRRAVFVELSDKGRALIELYLYETLTIGQ